MPEHPEKPVRQAGGELVIPIAAIAFSLYFFSTILESPWTAQVSAFLIGGILIALCLGFIVRTALAVTGGSASLGLGALVRRDDWRSGRIGLLGATVGYVILIDWGGFTLTTFAFLALSMAILSRGRRLGYIGIQNTTAGATPAPRLWLGGHKTASATRLPQRSKRSESYPRKYPL